MSAPRSASEIADLAAPEPVPTIARSRVVIPGTDATFEARGHLRELGLRWDPATHAWHGELAATERRDLESQFRIEARSVVPLEAFSTEPHERPAPPVGPSPSQPALPHGDARPRPRDYSRTGVESRVLFRDADEPEDPERGAPRFSLLEITSGLADDSREAEERAAVRRLRDLRGRVKAARGVAATTPGLTVTLQRDWQRAAGFCAQFGITPEQLRRGVPTADAVATSEVREIVAPPHDPLGELRAREGAILPGSCPGR